MIVVGTFADHAQVDLGDIVLAIASDVGNWWKSLVDLLGMDSRRDVQRIQHECSKTQDGTSSLAQVMFFPSRLVSMYVHVLLWGWLYLNDAAGLLVA